MSVLFIKLLGLQLLLECLNPVLTNVWFQLSASSFFLVNKSHGWLFRYMFQLPGEFFNLLVFVLATLIHLFIVVLGAGVESGVLTVSLSLSWDFGVFFLLAFLLALFLLRL